jgi:vitamin B12 transporter
MSIRENARFCAAAFAAGLFMLSSAQVAAEEKTGDTKTKEVVVTASRVPLSAERVGSAVTVIDAEDLENRQAQSVAEVLQEVPGVAVSRSGGIGSFTEVRIRGAEANQTLVLIDGVRVNDPSRSNAFNLDNLLAGDVERIEVLRGPQSALYGSEAVGGVINIITKRGSGSRVSAGLEGSTLESYRFTGSVSHSEENYAFYLGFTRFDSDSVSALDRKAPGVTESDPYDNTTINGNLQFFVGDNLEFSFNGRYTDATVEYDPDVFDPVTFVSSVQDQPGVFTDSTEATGKAQAKLTLLDGQWEQLVSASISDISTDTTDPFFFIPQTSTNGQVRSYQYQSNFFFSAPELAGSEHTLVLAAERLEEDASGTFLSGGQAQSLASNSLIGEYELALYDSLFLGGSLRYQDNKELFDNSTTFRLTGAYLHRDTGTRLHASYGKAVKNPTLTELFGFGAGFTGNPNLVPETSYGWDLGVEQSFWGERGSLDLTYFDNRIQDLIVGTGMTAFNASGENRIRGVEVSGSLEPVEGLTLGASYTFTDSEDAAGDELIRRPRHTASFNANYRFLNDRANVNLGVVHKSSQDDLDFATFPATRVELDGYTTVNLAASYEVVEGVRIFGRLENLTDAEVIDVFQTRGPGTTAYVGVTLSFSPE